MVQFDSARFRLGTLQVLLSRDSEVLGNAGSPIRFSSSRGFLLLVTVVGWRLEITLRRRRSNENIGRTFWPNRRGDRDTTLGRTRPRNGDRQVPIRHLEIG